MCAESDKKEEERTCPVYFHSNGTSGVLASSVDRYQMNWGVPPWNKKNFKLQAEITSTWQWDGVTGSA